MSEQVLRNGNVVARSKTRTITQIAMLGAIAGVLMNLEFPLPFLAPSFYQLDFSEIPVLVGSFAMGPIAGVLIELVKILDFDMSAFFYGFLRFLLTAAPPDGHNHRVEDGSDKQKGDNHTAVMK